MVGVGVGLELRRSSVRGAAGDCCAAAAAARGRRRAAQPRRARAARRGHLQGLLHGRFQHGLQLRPVRADAAPAAPAAAAASGVHVAAAGRRRRRRCGTIPSSTSSWSQTHQLASISSGTAVCRRALQPQLHVLVFRSAAGAALDAALARAAGSGVGLYVCYRMGLYGEPSDCAHVLYMRVCIRIRMLYVWSDNGPRADRSLLVVLVPLYPIPIHMHCYSSWWYSSGWY